MKRCCAFPGLTGMHRHALNRFLTRVAPLQRPSRYTSVICRGQASTAGEPRATAALLDKVHDKELLKVHGFIGGQWVPASDGTVMEVLNEQDKLRK